MGVCQSDGPEVAGNPSVEVVEADGKSSSTSRKAADAIPIFVPRKEMVVYVPAFIFKVQAFKSIPREDLPKVADAFIARPVKKGEQVMQQGDEGNEMFVIEAGKVSVWIQEPGQSTVINVAVLEAGDFFGEVALLENAPRNASVWAHHDENDNEDVVLRVLSRQAFDALDLKSKAQLSKKTPLKKKSMKRTRSWKR